MRNYVGIDLGTTNSVIASYDGKKVTTYQSPAEQAPITPSCIFFSKRGKQYGRRAYDMGAQEPDQVAKDFKRLMGSSTPIRIAPLDLSVTPEECSTEILKVLFGYLPEEIRNSKETGTVITVPAAFNQMQKTATMSSAESASLGKVALMQEPVAAVMSVMRAYENGNGMFIIFDFGGGTLDIAIAQSVSGKVALLEHGGIEMCGGRDFDRILVDNLVTPWLFEKFKLPENYSVHPRFRKLHRLSLWAAERAKIQLSQMEETAITLDDSDTRLQDLSGEPIYLDVPLSRSLFDGLIMGKLDEAIEATRQVMERAQISPLDVQKLVFVGGPTKYKPFQDYISGHLGIPAGLVVDPLTAVAEGAALFAESIDWETTARSRKVTRGSLDAKTTFGLSFQFLARTPDLRGKIAAVAKGKIPGGMEVQFDCVDTGWTSGRRMLEDGLIQEVTLSKMGDNTFKVFVFDTRGYPIQIGNDLIVICRTAATVDSIPSSSSIGVAVREKAGGSTFRLEYLIKAGDPLPKKGKVQFLAGEALRANGPGSLSFELWEGEIETPVTDNRFIGVFKIKGSAFEEGVIQKGDELICEYEIRDSGVIDLSVSVPSVAAHFRPNFTFYSPQEGKLDFTQSALQVQGKLDLVEERLGDIQAAISDKRVGLCLEKVDEARRLAQEGNPPEDVKKSMDNVYDIKKMVTVHLPPAVLFPKGELCLCHGADQVYPTSSLAP